MTTLQNILATGLLLLTATFSVSAQQEAQYTQYMYNQLNINPAYAGSRDVLSVVGLHRTQWAGLEGAPTTQTLSLHSPVGMSGISLGGSILSDKIGPTNEVAMSVDGSYKIDLSRTSNLRFGLKLGFNRVGVDLSGVNYVDPTDTAASIDGNFNPMVGAGVFFSTEKTYVGLSVPNFIQMDAYKLYENNVVTAFTQRMHAYLSAGHVFDLSQDIKFKPAILSKLVMGAPLQVDVSANFLLFDKLTVGGAYRYGAAFSGLLGYQINDSLLFGISYDKEPTELGNTNFNDGTYEVMMRYELFKSYSRIVTPRFF